MSVVLNDSFARANANPAGSPYSTQAACADCQISGQIFEGTSTDNNSVYDSLNPYSNDHFVQVTVAGCANGVTFYLRCRLTTPATSPAGIQWAIIQGDTTSLLQTYDSRSLGSPVLNTAPAIGDVYRLECRGQNYRCFQNGVYLGTFIDNTGYATSGTIGFGFFTGATQADSQYSRVTAGNLDPTLQAGYDSIADQEVTYSGGGLSLQDGTGIALGDAIMVSTSIPGSYPTLVFEDGTVRVDSGADNTRQQINYLIYRQASASFDGPGILWDNAHAPVWLQSVFLHGLINGTAILPIDLVGDGYVYSPDGDDLTFSVGQLALPDGITLSSDGILTGTPDVSGDFPFTIIATDEIDASTESDDCLISIQDALFNGPLTPQIGRRRAHRTLVVLPFEDLPPDMTPEQRGEQVRLDELRSEMQGVFSGSQPKIQAQVDRYRSEQERLASLSSPDKHLESVLRKINL